MLWKLRIPLKAKLITAIFLCSGVFVVAAAGIRLAMTYSKNPSTLTMNVWGTLETSSAIIAVNTTMLRPLFTRKFWGRDETQRSSPRRLLPSIRRLKRRGVYSTEALGSDETTTNTCGSTTLCSKEKATIAGTTVVETEIGREDGPVFPMAAVPDSDEIFGSTQTYDEQQPQRWNAEKMV